MTYTIFGFGAANRDELSDKLKKLLTEHTKNETLKKLACEKYPASSEGQGGRRAKSSVSKEFGGSLDALMKQLSETDHHYVRCLKPNQKLERGVWDEKFMQEQLEYSGMKELVEVRKAGLNVRRKVCSERIQSARASMLAS